MTRAQVGPWRLFGSLALLVGCYDNDDDDRDHFTSWEGDCDDRDPDIHPSGAEVAGDGIDQDCNGTDLPTVSLEHVATGIIYSREERHTIGYTVDCGPDVDGNGIGDLAFNGETWEERYQADQRQRLNAVYRLDEPVKGRVDQADLGGWHIRQGRARGPAVGTTLALVGAPMTPGLAFSAASPADDSRPRERGEVRLRFATTPADTSLQIDDLFADREQSTLGYPFVSPDLTGDGRPDFVLGNVPRGVAIWPGPPEGEVFVDDAPIIVEMVNVEPGGLAQNIGAGDLDGDGAEDDLAASASDSGFGYFPDVVVSFGPFQAGVNPTSPANAVYLYGTLPLGTSPLAVGDFNEDGVDDLAVGSDPMDDFAGRVWVYFGPLQPGEYDLEADADAVFRAETPWSTLGISLTAGDFDGDGYENLVIGADMYPNSTRVARAGLVYVMDSPMPRGELGTEHVKLVLQGAQRDDGAGKRVVACDVDGDGRDELMVGAYLHDFDRNAPRAGRVYWLEDVQRLLR